MSNDLGNHACSGANRVIEKQPDSSHAGAVPSRLDNEKWRLGVLETPTAAAPREFRGCANPTAVIGQSPPQKQRPRAPSPPLDRMSPLRLLTGSMHHDWNTQNIVI